MKISKADVFGGLPAELARTVLRRFSAYKPAWVVRGLLGDEDETARTLELLAAEGLLEEREPTATGQRWWRATVRGNALAMASFNRPIKRATADRLVADVVGRAADYNKDASRPFFVERLRVFGSYLNPDVGELGDVDIEVTVGSRDFALEEFLAYADASGREFGSHFERITWPRRELLLTLRGRSSALSLLEEDVSDFAAEVREIYPIRE